MKSLLFLKLSFLVCNVSASPYQQNFDQRCLSLSQLLTDSVLGVKAVVQPSQFIKAGTNITFPEVPADCNRPFRVASVDLCRVSLNVTTSPQSQIRMEAWLPFNWTGRFLSAGNGGLGGCIQYEDIDYAASLGFAAVGANNGHEDTTGRSFYQAPDVIEDYAYRSLHTGVVVGKKISRAFYGTSHKKSYYLGCSTGGRQGWKSVQQFPGDFDGVVAGAPAFGWNNLTAWSSGFYPIVGRPDAPTFVPLPLWTTIHQDILKQCDLIDGVADGILEDPSLCNYDPSSLLCGTEGTSASFCLTTIQVETVRKIFSPFLDPRDGSVVYPRMQPGSEIAGSAAALRYNGRPFGGSDWFKYAILANQSWDPITLSPADWQLGQKLNLFNIHAWDGDISAFKKRGGKVLHYHGLQDGVITSENSPRYYEHVSKTLGLKHNELDKFYRYFRISGLAHCTGGTGPIYIGNQARNLATTDPKENVLMAVVKWVEEGVAPNVVRGTAYVGGNRTAGMVDYQRDHCRWPYRNTYDGTGNPKNLKSWKCVLPK